MAKTAKLANRRKIARYRTGRSVAAPPLEVADRAAGCSWDATVVKNRFGEALKASREQPVFIAKHGRAEAVLISKQRYDQLLEAAQTTQAQRLVDLRGEFQALYSQMQTAKSRQRIERLSKVTPERMVDVITAARRGK